MIFPSKWVITLYRTDKLYSNPNSEALLMEVTGKQPQWGKLAVLYANVYGNNELDILNM